jgi:hypothetical protein
MSKFTNEELDVLTCLVGMASFNSTLTKNDELQNKLKEIDRKLNTMRSMNKMIRQER